MTPAPLENLVAIGSLKREPPSQAEFDNLMDSGAARLHDARNESLAMDGRFDLAYNAAHALSLAALRRAGYRSSSRFMVFQALEHTLGVPAPTWRVLAKAHVLRSCVDLAFAERPSTTAMMLHTEA